MPSDKEYEVVFISEGQRVVIPCRGSLENINVTLHTVRKKNLFFISILINVMLKMTDIWFNLAEKAAFFFKRFAGIYVFKRDPCSLCKICKIDMSIRSIQIRSSILTGRILCGMPGRVSRFPVIWSATLAWCPARHTLEIRLLSPLSTLLLLSVSWKNDAQN